MENSNVVMVENCCEGDKFLSIGQLAELFSISPHTITAKVEKFGLKEVIGKASTGKKVNLYSLQAFKKMCSDDDDEAHRLKADASAVRKHEKMTTLEKAQSLGDTLVTIAELAKMENKSESAIRAQFSRFKMPIIEEAKDTKDGKMPAQYSLATYRAKAVAAAAELLWAQQAKQATKLIEKAKPMVVGEVIMQTLDSCVETEDLASIDLVIAKAIQSKVSVYSNKSNRLENQLRRLQDVTDSGERYYSILRVAKLYELAGFEFPFSEIKSILGKTLSQISRESKTEILKQQTIIDTTRSLYSINIWKQALPDILDVIDFAEGNNL